MKSSIKILSIIVAFFAMTVNGFATGNEPTEDKSSVVTTTENSAITLRLYNLDNQNTSIKIKSNAGEMIYFKKVKNTTDYALRINLSKLVDGSYTLIVNRNEKQFFQNLIVTHGTVSIGGLVEAQKPTVSITDNGFEVEQVGQTVKNLSILDKKGDVIFTKYFDDTAKEASGLKFILPEDMKGNFTIRIETPYDYYYNDLNI